MKGQSTHRMIEMQYEEKRRRKEEDDEKAL